MECSQVLLGEEVEPQLEAADEADGGGAQRPFRGFAPFGMRADVFYKQSESLEVAAPELHVTRAAVLDYFHGLATESDQLIFHWEAHGWTMKPGRADLEFSRRVAACYYKPTGQQAQLKQVSGEDKFLEHNFAEFRALRDVAFWWKYMLCVDKTVFPPLQPYHYSQATLAWELSSERSVYRASRVVPRYLSRLPSSAWRAAQRLRLRRPLPEAGGRAAASYWALSGTAAPPECGAPPRANCCKPQAAGRGGKLRRHPGHSFSPQRRHVLARFVLGERAQRGARAAPYVALLPPLRLDVPVQATLARLLDAEAQLERCRRRQAEEQQQRRREAEPHRGLFAAQPRRAEDRVSQRVGGERLALQVVEQQEHRVDASTEQRAEDLKRAEERE